MTSSTPDAPGGSHRTVSGQIKIWNELSRAEAFDRIASENPTHRALFERVRHEVTKVESRGHVDRIIDAGGGTALFAESLRANGIETPVTLIDPGEHGTTAVAMKKGVPGLEIVPKSFELYDIARREGERLVVISTYVLHNFTPDLRRLFFYWLSHNLHKDEIFILGDTVADDPVGSEVRATRADVFAAAAATAVGAEHWRDREDIPIGFRNEILDHTRDEDSKTVPGWDEYVKLASDFGFSIEPVHQEGYLRTVVFKKL